MRKWLILGILCAPPCALGGQQPARHGPNAWRLADRAARSRRTDVVTAASDTIEKWAAAHPEPEVILALAYVHLIRKERTKLGPDILLGAPASALAKAVTLFMAGQDSAGAEVYFAALENAGPNELEAYYATVLPLAEDGVIDTLSAATHAGWVRSVWQSAANADRTPLSVRMGEHFRRLTHVAQVYRSFRKRPPTEVNYRQIRIPRHLQHLGLDDRGIIYLLNGNPSRRVAGVGNCKPSESWLYIDPIAHLIVHFGQLETANQYVLISDPEDLCPDGQARIDILDALRPIDPTYGRLLLYFDYGLGNIPFTNIDNRPESDQKPLPPSSFETLRRELDDQVRQMAHFALHPLSRSVN